MKINGNVFFDPWIGNNYESGLKGDRILVIGFQHWCDPTYWKCDQNPHECLDKRDSKCTVWNAKCYRPKELNENDKKPSGWEYLNNDIMPNCPIENCNERSKCTGTESNSPRFRYLHCETKISIYNHINNQERTKRASIFGAILLALEELYSIGFQNKKKCWNSIAFANFIQHYTKIDNENPNRIDINEELQIKAEKNSVALEYLFKKNKSYLKPIPNIIIVLKLNKTTMSLIKNICSDQYFECKHISIMTPMGGTFTFSVFATKDSYLYKKIKKDLKAFVDYYLCKKLQVNTDNGDLKTRKSDIARKIQALAEFLKEHKNGIESKPLYKYRDDILKNENIDESIRKEFYSNNDCKHQKISLFNDIKRKKVEHLLDTEFEKIKNAYEEFKGTKETS